MREIKFRVFSYEGNEMLDWEWLKEAPDLAEFIKHPEECAYYSNLMQYTGLKDKNGIEIYEGDIVETDLGKGVVVFDSAAFLIRNLEDDEYYGFEDFFSLYEGGCYLVEVIGNVHANPELLEGME